jgi:hypothetical protein
MSTGAVDHRLAAENGVVSAYLHAGPAPSLGRMGSLLTLESSGVDPRCDCSRNALLSIFAAPVGHMLKSFSSLFMLMLADLSCCSP